MTDPSPPTIVGNARVSTADQSDGGQFDALRPGDVLAVTEVSRLGRTTADGGRSGQSGTASGSSRQATRHPIWDKL